MAQPEEEAAPAPGAGPEERLAWLEARLQAVAADDTGLAGGKVAVAVMAARSGEMIFQERADQATHVASNVKILTTAATLSRLGPNFRYRTSILAERVGLMGEVEGDLYLRGRGDPVLDARDIEDMAAELWRTGIKSVGGRIVVDDSYFGGSITPPYFDSFEDPLDQHARFRAPVAGLTIERGTFQVIIAPSRSGQGPAQVTIDPPSDYIEVAENQVITQVDGRARLGLEIEIEKNRMLMRVSGQIRAFGRPTRYRFRVEDPALHAGYVLKRALADHGIKVRGRVERGDTPSNVRVLATAVSPPLGVLVRRMGKRSDNAVAEALLATLGAERVARAESRPATWDDGVAQLRDFLVTEAGFPDDESFHVANGSGLYGDTRISPALLVRVLEVAHRSPRYGPEFLSSLAIAGTDGTLRRRLRGSRARGLVRAKSGTLGAVSALSGYASVPGGETLIFSVVHSGMPGMGNARNRSRRAARIAQNRIAEILMEYLDASLPPGSTTEDPDGEAEESDEGADEDEESDG